MAEGEVKEKPKKGLSLPVVVGLVVGAVVLQVGVLFLLFRLFFHVPAQPPPASASSAQAETAAEAHSEAPTGVIVPVEDLVVNPRGSSSRYVLVALGLEVANAKQGERLRQELMIPVRDKIMAVVSSYSIEELQAEGSRDSLRVRIRQELNGLLPGIQLRNVYFSKFVIQ
jgi:flagellar basal body-associated protein FliL